MCVMRQDTYHGAECDEANEGVWGDKAQANNQCVAKSLQILLLQASVDDKQKDGGHRCRAGKRVFDGGVFGQELSRQIGIGDILVVRRECITLQAERADPEFTTDINLAKFRRGKKKLSIY